MSSEGFFSRGRTVTSFRRDIDTSKHSVTTGDGKGSRSHVFCVRTCIELVCENESQG